MGAFPFDALAPFPVPGPELPLLPPGLALGWEPAAFRAYVRVLQGLQPCCGAGLEAERAFSFGLLCFLQQNSHREPAGVRRCPALVRLWFCPGVRLMAAFAITDVLFLKKCVWRGVRNLRYNFP